MFAPIKINDIKTPKDFVLVTDMNFGERTTGGGLVLLNDDSRSSGIRPRWGKVYAVGNTQTDVKVGQWVLVAHGRWTRGVTIEDETGEKTIRRVDTNDIMLVTDETPSDDTQSDAVIMDQKNRW
jgi:co-chaperonin GroES (HSP10)